MAQTVADARVAGERRLPMSFEEFLAWPGEGTHAEWVDGEAIFFMPTKWVHARLVQFLSKLLGLFVDIRQLGALCVAPFGMRLGEGRSFREPDLLFVAQANLYRITPDMLEGPADLVVEIISDDSVARDRADKFYEYQAAGIPEYWLADPRPGRERFDPYILTPRGRYQAVLPDDGGRVHSTALPGFWLDPDWLWQDPLPDPIGLLARIAPEAFRAAVDRTGAEPTG
jgi:Uma2 family endonuclease